MAVLGGVAMAGEMLEVGRRPFCRSPSAIAAAMAAAAASDEKARVPMIGLSGLVFIGIGRKVHSKKPYSFR